VSRYLFHLTWITKFELCSLGQTRSSLFVVSFAMYKLYQKDCHVPLCPSQTLDLHKANGRLAYGTRCSLENECIRSHVITMMTLTISLQFNLFELLTYYLKGCVKISISSYLNYKVWTVLTWSNSKFSVCCFLHNVQTLPKRLSRSLVPTTDPWPVQRQWAFCIRNTLHPWERMHSFPCHHTSCRPFLAPA
jgi:hypothetical protein